VLPHPPRTAHRGKPFVPSEKLCFEIPIEIGLNPIEASEGFYVIAFLFSIPAVPE